MTASSEPPVVSDPPPTGGATSAAGLVGAVRKDRLRAALFDEPLRERRIGRYRVVGLLGRGGMGTVLEAVDDALERRVALKLLHHDVPAREQGRLLREARALARLSHPHVVQVHEVGEHPRPFIAMELVRGRTLAEWQRERPPWRACVQAYLQAGRGLAAVHAQSLVHRDFKPTNCMIDDEGRVRVMDFGLARTLGPHVEPTPSPRATLADAATEGAATEGASTDGGAVLGTLAYMSLEQLQGRTADARSDQLGFCVALYEAVYGERPFAGQTVAGLERAIAAGEVRPPPPGRRVPLGLRRVLLRGLAADPAQRWPAMEELLAALERLVRPRWRGRLALAALLGGLSLTGVNVWNELATRRACVGVEHQLDGVWDPERRERLREALLGSSLPYAATAWEGVEPRLGAYAEAWVAATRDVCEEANVRREQPASVVALRTACLHARKVALREAVDVLASAEPEVVERGVTLVAGLPAIERCADLPALLAEVPPPDDAELLARVQGLRDQLIEARALRLAGRYADSLALVEGIAAGVTDAAHPPLTAEHALARGWALYGQVRHDEAVVAFEHAYAEAAAVGHDAVAASAATLLTFIVGERQAKPEVGLKWALTARAHAKRPAAEAGAEALALANVGAVYQQQGDLERARSSYEEALRQQEEAFGPDDVSLAFTLNGLALVRLAGKAHEEALALHQRALALRRRALGPSHPHVAMSLNNIGVALHQQGRLAEAEPYYREALAIKAQILGPESPELVSSITNLGVLAFMQHDFDGALGQYERALAILEQSEGSWSARLASLLQNIGAVHWVRGRPADAEASFRRALAIRETVHGPAHVNVLESLHWLGRVALERGDVATAAGYVERASVVLAQEDHPSRTEVMLLQVRLGLARGEAASVVALAEQAYALREQRASPGLTEARFLWSRALGEADPSAHARARELAAQSRAALESQGDPQSQLLRAEVERWLAELDRRAHAPGRIKHPDPPR